MPAIVQWVVTDGELPDAATVREAPSLACADDGTFVISPSIMSGTIYLIAAHPDGVRGYIHATLPVTEEAMIELAPAGGVEIRLPGNRLAFQVALTPANSAVAEAGDPRRRVVADGVGESVRCGGIPLSWRSARVSILWRDGGRIDVRDAADLRFRTWTIITIPMYDYTASVLGTLVNSAGDPVGGAEVSAFRPGRVQSRLPSTWDRTAGPNGSFKLEDLPPGDLTLSLWKKGLVPLRQDISLAAGQVLDLGTITLESGAVLRGRVVGLRSDALEAARVTLSKADGSSQHAAQFSPFAQCDENGRYEFSGVGSGDWLVALLTGRPTAQAPWVGRLVTVKDANGTVVQVPDLGPAERLTWQASFRSESASTLAGARIVARGIDRVWASYGRVSPSGAISLSVATGRFLLGVVLDGGFRWLGVFSAEMAPEVLDVPTASLTLSGRPSIPKNASRVELVYTGGSIWPEDVLPLVSEVAPLPRDARTCRIDGLTAGSYEIHVTTYGQESSSTVVLAVGESKTIPWPTVGGAR